MEIKAYICPTCGGPLEVEYDTTFTICPHCGSKIHISYEGETPPVNPNLRQFTASDTGIPLACAVVPPDYTLKGTLNGQWQCDMVPFTTFVQAVSPDQSIVLASSSKEVFEEYLNPIMKKMIARMPNVNRSGLRDFVEPEVYLQQYAEHIAGVPVTPVAKTALPSAFGKNLQRERAELLAFFTNHTVNANARIEVSNLVCDPILMKFSARLGTQEMVVLAGADYQGVECYDANNVIAGFQNILEDGQNLFGGVQNALGSMFSGRKSKTEKPKNMWEFAMGGGIIGQMMRNKNEAGKDTAHRSEPFRQSERQTEKKAAGPIPLGHAREYGKRSDVIQWGSKRLYAMVATAEKEQEATEIFLRFVESLVPDPALEQQAGALADQMFRQRTMEAQRMQMQARQMQMQTLQMQQNLSRHIAQNNAEISAGIMDSYEKRSAAQSCMSTNYSEAIRGVNSYVTPTWTTVEASVGADHVYQNKYGDIIGVSGNAVDEDIVSKLNWTELNRK